MTWVRFDDLFPIHRKVAGLSDSLYRLHTEAIFWCARNTTDGVIRKTELAQISARSTAKRAANLVEAGVWHTAGDLCTGCKEALADAGTPEPRDGWVIHDYLVFQPSRSKVVHERQAKAERQARWLESKRNSRPSRDASQVASKGSSRDALKDIAPRDANPAPPRPEGSGAGPRAPGPRPLPPGGRGSRGSRENPDWQTLPAYGTPRDPVDAERARRGAAAARELLKQPPQEAS
jgi:hypothetical protein